MARRRGGRTSPAAGTRSLPGLLGGPGTFGGRRAAGGRRRPVAAVAGLLAVLTVAVVVRSPVDRLDSAVLRWSPESHWPWLMWFASRWVVLGQRGICLAIAVTWLAVRAARHREARPLIRLVVAELVLNAFVGSMKIAVGRLGPLQLGAEALAPGASHVLTDGTIFPSGHTANAVVTWGFLAVVARRPRRLWAAVATVMAVSVGLTTVYLGTHWLSDVVAGWAAGGIVLLALPVTDPLVDRLHGWTGRLGRRRRPAPAAPTPSAG